MADVSSGHSENQVDQHAAIQRKGIDRVLIHHLAHTRVLSFEQFARSLNRHALFFGAKAQLPVDRSLLAHFKIHGLRGLLESGVIHGERVRAGLQTHDLVKTGLVGHSLARDAGLAGQDVHLRPSNRAVLRVKNRSAHDGVVALRGERQIQS